MWSAAALIRRSIGSSVLSKLKQTTKHRCIYTDLTSKSRVVRLSQNPLFNYNGCVSARATSSVFNLTIIREFSTNDDSKKQNNDDDDDKKEEEEVDDDERVSRLPALFSVPELWPRLPIIVHKGSPIFPNFMKIFEVCHIIVVLPLSNA
jgi:hypothetical protein